MDPLNRPLISQNPSPEADADSEMEILASSSPSQRSVSQSLHVRCNVSYRTYMVYVYVCMYEVYSATGI